MRQLVVRIFLVTVACAALPGSALGYAKDTSTTCTVDNRSVKMTTRTHYQTYSANSSYWYVSNVEWWVSGQSSRTSISGYTSLWNAAGKLYSYTSSGNYGQHWYGLTVIKGNGGRVYGRMNLNYSSFGAQQRFSCDTPPTILG